MPNRSNRNLHPTVQQIIHHWVGIHDWSVVLKIMQMAGDLKYLKVYIYDDDLEAAHRLDRRHIHTIISSDGHNQTVRVEDMNDPSAINIARLASSCDGEMLTLLVKFTTEAKDNVLNLMGAMRLGVPRTVGSKFSTTWSGGLASEDGVHISFTWNKRWDLHEFQRNLGRGQD